MSKYKPIYSKPVDCKISNVSALDKIFLFNSSIAKPIAYVLVNCDLTNGCFSFSKYVVIGVKLGKKLKDIAMHPDTPVTILKYNHRTDSDKLPF